MGSKKIDQKLLVYTYSSECHVLFRWPLCKSDTYDLTNNCLRKFYLPIRII
jgi:hypothetical protein